MCSCLCWLCPLSMCLCLLSSVLLPTLHSIILFLRLLFYFAATCIFVHSVYARICVCIKSLCLCKLYFCPAMSFCPLCAFMPLCVFLSALLFFTHGVCVWSDLLSVSTLLALFLPTLGVCVCSRRCLRPLGFCPLCVLLVFFYSMSHQDLWAFCYFRAVGAYSNSRILQNIQLNHISAMQVHIAIHAPCSSFNLNPLIFIF